MIRIPPTVYEHHLMKGFPRLSSLVADNDAFIPLPVDHTTATEVIAFTAAAQLLNPTADAEHVTFLKHALDLMLECECFIRSAELIVQASPHLASLLAPRTSS